MRSSFPSRRVVFLVLLSASGLATAKLQAAPVAVSFPAVDAEPLGAVSPNATLLHDHWQMKEEALAGNNGANFSTADFKGADWYPTTVPTTALATLVRQGVYPDPYIGTNMMLIPDANDAENKRYDLLKYSHLPDHSNPWNQPYWFRTAFALPAAAGKTIWLHLDGINYRADVWLNGQQIASANDTVGMFRRFTFDVTKLIHAGAAPNALAVRIHELDFPGDPVSEQLGGIAGGMGPNAGDLAILKNVTMYQTVGWDWVPSVRDRNIGLWQNVWLEATGPVAVRDPAAFVDPKWLPGQDAPVTVRGYTDNPSSASIPVKIVTRIEPQGFAAPTVESSRDVQADPGRHEFIFSPADHPELLLHNPRVWWPVNYGEHPLYKVTVTASPNGAPSASASSLLGVRTVGTYVLNSGGRAFTCNGRTIRLTGGAWIPDMLLSWSAQRYRDEVRLMAEGNHTVVRVNGCGIMPPEVFFDACDHHGLLVWEDFSRTSPPTTIEADKDVLMANMVDFVDRARSHPSLLLWEGCNESVPQQDWAQPMQDQVLPAMDGTRPWLVSSSSRASWAPPVQMSSGGPYALVPLKSYFDLYKRGGSYACKNEIGMACPPPLNSLVQAFPNWDQPDRSDYPLNVNFGFHDATGPNYQATHDTVRRTYAPTPDLMEYLWLADLYTGSGYRAIYEAANKARPLNSGTHLWKVNTAWPSMMWQLFDWYLRPNAGYYGMKQACKPLHVQHSINDNGVQVVSTLPDARPDLQVKAEILSPAGKSEFARSFPVNAAADATTVVGSLAEPLSDDQLHFLALTLTDAKGKVLDRDVRWVQKDEQWGPLQTMAPGLRQGGRGKAGRAG